MCVCVDKQPEAINRNAVMQNAIGAGMCARPRSGKVRASISGNVLIVGKLKRFSRALQHFETHLSICIIYRVYI